MKQILLLGGTGWLGQTLSRQVLDRGHAVTALARGTKPFAPGVSTVIADRQAPDAYGQVAGRDWDLVIELTDRPRFAREAVQRLGGVAGNWVFVSSCSAYALQSEPGADETAAILEPLPESEDGVSADFGRAKAACELVTIQSRQGKALVVRPGLIGGPGDPSGRSSYWPLRFADPREPVLVPWAPEGQAHVQVIDVRDLAAFIMEAGIAGEHGPVNAVGRVHELGEALHLAQWAAQRVDLSRAAPVREATCVRYGVEHMGLDGVNPWAGPKSLPLVLPEGSGYAGFARRSDARATAAGLHRRSLGETFEDIVRHAGVSGTGMLPSGLSAAEETAVLEAVRKRGGASG
ncbi:NAD-dependent epimerase/dehydratase family protein [Paeniglutamicibacter psychrophenolicus]|uniref:NAD-dependent epimerase/dehydratase family protein n=1 Tax=Paeniglutamicibacter psychrophenolicus TaxID=257454 RepID=UPI0027812DC1|nr:NAD-dependent epimerase/dehydratase family protein [Paeniglutamicibacter psychrophenolicus]MDQ0095574.1 nucleoside-diphosphate-sugar epimerase [Paeniglutamicibacter psychrophenolicus]